MLMLLFGFVVFFWLVVGALQFVLCSSIPSLRRYALSAALWWAVWGPCSVVLMMFAGLTLVVGSLLIQHSSDSGLRFQHALATLGWGYLLLGTLLTVSTATLLAWLHQAIVRRFTFFLFRLYAAVVSAGIGSVLGGCVGFWLLGKGIHFHWLLLCLSMILLIVIFAVGAYKGARSLRGDAPERFTRITKEEFEGI